MISGSTDLQAFHQGGRVVSFIALGGLVGCALEGWEVSFPGQGGSGVTSPPPQFRICLGGGDTVEGLA